MFQLRANVRIILSKAEPVCHHWRSSGFNIYSAGMCEHNVGFQNLKSSIYFYCWNHIYSFHCSYIKNTTSMLVTKRYLLPEVQIYISNISEKEVNSESIKSTYDTLFRILFSLIFFSFKEALSLSKCPPPFTPFFLNS